MIERLRALARKYGLSVTSGYRESNIWPEARSWHYGDPGFPEMTRREARFYNDAIERTWNPMASTDANLEAAERYIEARYGAVPTTCVHCTPAGIVCPWCEL